MGNRLGKHRGFAFAAGLAAALLAPGIARPEEPDVINELRARIEALEKQNRQLMQMLERRQPAEEAQPVEAPGQPKPLDDDKVKKIVGDYLKERDDQKKKEQEEKVREAECQGWEVGKNMNFQPRWDNGLWFETPDRAFKFHVNGRLQMDPVWMAANDQVQFGEDGTGPINDGVGFRRARLGVDGTIWEVIDFDCTYDFLNTFDADPNRESGPPVVANTPVPTDAWVTITHLPLVGNLRIGHQKPPISFEHLTSSRFLNFMERSLTFDAWIGGLDNGFWPGVQLYNWYWNERASWAIGLFKNNDHIFGWNVGDGEGAVVGRLTFLPVYANDGRCLVHVGLGARHRDADEDRIRYRARTLLRNGNATQQTIMADLRANASGDSLLVPEFVVVWGPFTLQSEAYANWAHDVDFPLVVEPGQQRIHRDNAFFYGYYVELLYFLTGEHRYYNRRPGETYRVATFDRVTPTENFFFVDSDCGKLFGRGAWQVGARYSYIDLADQGLFGGIVQDVTLGLNWFWNPNMKFQWNYIVEHRDIPEGDSDGFVHGFGMRMAWDW